MYVEGLHFAVAQCTFLSGTTNEQAGTAHLRHKYIKARVLCIDSSLKIALRCFAHQSPHIFTLGKFRNLASNFHPNRVWDALDI